MRIKKRSRTRLVSREVTLVTLATEAPEPLTLSYQVEGPVAVVVQPLSLLIPDGNDQATVGREHGSNFL